MLLGKYPTFYCVQRLEGCECRSETVPRASQKDRLLHGIASRVFPSHRPIPFG